MQRLLMWVLPLIFLGGAVFSVQWLNQHRPQARQQSRPTPAPLTVNAMALTRAQHTPSIDAFGTITPGSKVRLLARVNGVVTALSPNFREGGHFSKADELLSLDGTDQQLALSAAEAKVAQAIANQKEEAARARQAQAEWKTLGRSGTPSEMILRKPQQAAAAANLKSAQAEHQRAKLELARTRILAPFSGMIESIAVDIGQYVTPGTQVAEIFSNTSLQATLPITLATFAQLPAFDANHPLAVTLTLSDPAATSIAAQIFDYKNSLNANTGQIQLIARIADTKPNTRLPLAGQFVRAQIASRPLPDTFRLPRSALQNGGEALFVVEGKLQLRTLQPLWLDTQYAYVRDNIRDEALLVVSAISTAVSGTAVKVRLVTEDSTTATPSSRDLDEPDLDAQS